jgi:L-ascorbate metabolism protein UlaG (beta-lactamase superfamily)
MRIRWNGHACFTVEAKEGRLVTDPFAKEVPYDLPKTTADVVTVSHEHFDHDAVDRVGGNPTVVRQVGEFVVAGISIRGIESFHDDRRGAERGANRIYAFTLEGIRLAHLGDLGTPLDGPQREALSDVEILFVPVGGHFTIDASRAAAIARSLPEVRVVIPMHFKTDRVADWPIATVEEFESLMDNVRRVGASTVEVTRASMPEQREVWILDHA